MVSAGAEGLLLSALGPLVAKSPTAQVSTFVMAAHHAHVLLSAIGLVVGQPHCTACPSCDTWSLKCNAHHLNSCMECTVHDNHLLLLLLLLLVLLRQWSYKAPLYMKHISCAAAMAVQDMSELMVSSAW